MSNESFIKNPTPEGLSALIKTELVQVCKQLYISFNISVRKCKLKKLIAEYYVDNNEWDEGSLNMFLIDTSSVELELKKLEMKLKIEAELKQTKAELRQAELKHEQELKQTELELKQKQELELRKAELKQAELKQAHELRQAEIKKRN